MIKDGGQDYGERIKVNNSSYILNGNTHLIFSDSFGCQLPRFLALVFGSLSIRLPTQLHQLSQLNEWNHTFILTALHLFTYEIMHCQVRTKPNLKQACKKNVCKFLITPNPPHSLLPSRLHIHSQVSSKHASSKRR
jgi:hypothetical protein